MHRCRQVESRIVCACRNGHVYTIKNGSLTGSPIELEAMPCGASRDPNRYTMHRCDTASRDPSHALCRIAASGM